MKKKLPGVLPLTEHDNKILDELELIAGDETPYDKVVRIASIYKTLIKHNIKNSQDVDRLLQKKQIK